MHNFDLIKPDKFVSCQGVWSGTEGRHKKHFVAMIPASRYQDEDESITKNPFWKLKRTKLNWDKSTGLTNNKHHIYYEPNRTQTTA